MDKDYAIVVGIDNYLSLPRLSSAVRDASAFAEWLRKPAPEGGGIDPKKLQIIVSPEVQSEELAEPLQMKIDRALKNFGVGDDQAPKTFEVGDERFIGRRLYFYFSGHGIGVEFDNVAMLMANASKAELNSNIGLRPYLSFFRARELFQEVVFILDCCRDQVTRIPIEPMRPVFTIAEKVPAPGVKDYVFLAGVHGEPAFSVPAGNGLFTEALMEGLSGAAANQTGAVTSQSLSDYVVKRVEERAGELKLKQAPRLERGINEGLVFCTVQNTVQVKIYAAPGITGTLQIRDGKLKPVGEKDISLFDKNNPWTVPLAYTTVPYLIQNVGNGGLEFLDLGQIKDKNYEFQFSGVNG